MHTPTLKPCRSIVMHWLRLDRITPEKRAMRAKAKRALLRFTGAAIETLREDDEEFLQGGWARRAVGARRCREAGDEAPRGQPGSRSLALRKNRTQRPLPH